MGGRVVGFVVFVVFFVFVTDILHSTYIRVADLSSTHDGTYDSTYESSCLNANNCKQVNILTTFGGSFK